MSTIYKFQDSEPTVTPGTTATPLLATDVVVAYSANLGRTVQASVGSVAVLAPATTATSATTATAITAFGLTSVTPTTNCGFTLADPLQVGAYKTIFCTSTATQVITTASAQIVATDATSGLAIQLTFKGAYVELQSISTAKWALVGRSAVGVLCT